MNNENNMNPAPIHQLVGRWLPIGKYDPRCRYDAVKVIFYHPDHVSESGKIVKKGITFINWPDVPSSHFYLVPNPPNAEDHGPPRNQSNSTTNNVMGGPVDHLVGCGLSNEVKP